VLIVNFATEVDPAGGFRYPAIAVQLIEPSIRPRLQYSTEAGKMGLRMESFLFRLQANHTAGASADPALRSSRTYVHNRPVFVFLLPGNNTGTGEYRREAFRQTAHSSEAPLLVVAAVGNMRPPSPTAVNGSAPHPSGCIFLTGGTAECALHTLRSAPGPEAPLDEA